MHLKFEKIVSAMQACVFHIFAQNFWHRRVIIVTALSQFCHDMRLSCWTKFWTFGFPGQPLPCYTSLCLH